VDRRYVSQSENVSEYRECLLRIGMLFNEGHWWIEGMLVSVGDVSG
jgi:hypothetical protein